MKTTIKTLLVALLMGATSTLCMGQSDSVAFKPKSNIENVGDNDIFTGSYYTDKFGNQWKIYKTTQGNYYCYRQSRSGNWYRMYMEKGGSK
jgi:hypothetical protein